MNALLQSQPALRKLSWEAIGMQQQVTASIASGNRGDFQATDKEESSLLQRKKWKSKSSDEKTLHRREKEYSINLTSLPHKSGRDSSYFYLPFRLRVLSWTHSAKGAIRSTIVGWIWRQKCMKNRQSRKEACTKSLASEEAP